MNAHAKPTPRPYTAIAHSMIHKTCDATDFTGVDRWAAVRVLAANAPADLDIGDEREVVMYLINMRRSAKEINAIVEDVADAVREMRQRAMQLRSAIND